MKAELIVDAWQAAGLDAAAVGPADWALGAGWLTELLVREKVPVLAANLVCDGKHPFPGGKVVEIGGKRIGLVGITAGNPEGCTVEDPAPALRDAVAALGPTDVTIGLLPLDLQPLAVVASGSPPLDLGLTGGVRATSDGKFAIPLFEAGARGRQVEILDLTWQAGATTWLRAGQPEEIAQRITRTETRLHDAETRIAGAPDDAARQRFTKQKEAYVEQLERDRALAAGMKGGLANLVSSSEVTLGVEIADEPKTAALVAAAKEKIGATVPTADALVTPHRVPAGSRWAGSDSCAGCHRTEHQQWAGTAHSHALGSLAAAERAADEACWTCHVTGANQPGGPTSAAAIGPFRDVQCEACHGPSAAHVADPAGVKPVRTPGVATCTTCHDGEQDQGRFDLDSYLPQVRHLTGAAPAPAKGVRRLPSSE
jgi:hypothetical protein